MVFGVAISRLKLRCGGLHLVVTEVVPVSAGCVDKKLDFYFHKIK